MARLSRPGNLLPSLLPYFPTVRAGASNPGDDGRTNLAMRLWPWPPYDLLPPCEKAPFHRRSPLWPLRGHDGEVLFLLSSASLLLASTLRDGIS